MVGQVTVETGWRLRDDGTREIETMPAWQSDSGFAALAEAVCAPELLASYGLAPMKPYRGEPQWQLVHMDAERFYGMDTFEAIYQKSRGYQRLLPPKAPDENGGFAVVKTHDGTADGDREAADIEVPEGMELTIDIARDYRQACLAILNEHDEHVFSVVRDGQVALRDGQPPTQRSQNGERWHSDGGMPGLEHSYQVKNKLCASTGAGVCPTAMNRRWQAPEYVAEHYFIHSQKHYKPAEQAGGNRQQGHPLTSEPLLRSFGSDGKEL